MAIGDGFCGGLQAFPTLPVSDLSDLTAFRGCGKRL